MDVQNTQDSTQPVVTESTTSAIGTCEASPCSVVFELLQARKLLEAHKLSTSNSCANDGASCRACAPAAQHGSALQTLLEQLLQDDDPSWSHVTDQKRLQGWYKQHADGHNHSVKVAMLFDGPMQQPLAMGWEFDLISSWNSYATDTLILQHEGHDLYAYCSVWLPFPFPEPQAVLRASMWDLTEEHGAYAVAIQSVAITDLDTALRGKLPEKAHSKRKEIVVHDACVLLKPVQPTAGAGTSNTACTLAAILAHIDPKLPVVPAWLVQFVMKVMLPFVHKSMQKQISRAFRDPTSIHHVRSQQRALYASASLAHVAILQRTAEGVVFQLDRLLHGRLSAGMGVVFEGDVEGGGAGNVCEGNANGNRKVALGSWFGGMFATAGG